MSAQRSDAQVARDAALANKVIHDLKAGLRRQGIRNVHTSPKAREAIRRAAARRIEADRGAIQNALDPLQIDLLQGAA